MTKTSKNMKCPCGSGKRYSRCCKDKSNQEVVSTFDKYIANNIAFRGEVDEYNVLMLHVFKNYVLNSGFTPCLITIETNRTNGLICDALMRINNVVKVISNELDKALQGNNHVYTFYPLSNAFPQAILIVDRFITHEMQEHLVKSSINVEDIKSTKIGFYNYRPNGVDECFEIFESYLVPEPVDEEEAIALNAFNAAIWHSSHDAKYDKVELFNTIGPFFFNR